ncbi:hypothetical protein LC608_35590 [Nostoc sp. XA010]|uniref:Z1 domain-containing protein n=1 Tax=Nostoc sp. XA010 TaxID=2780407 RepID=UPI001E5CB2CC|nr:Z1 domain-containing protein [Nostoc sp. XA010]MCC5662141.1 hypothetical protein [Nostoc sp. XA010]
MVLGSLIPGQPRSIAPGGNIDTLRQFMQQHEGISGQDFDNILLSAIDVLNRCVSPDVAGSTQGLIYGHIQSGKTAVIITVMALALDNGYRNFVVLTSDLNDLYLQTLNRIQSSLHSFVVLGKQEFGDLSTGVSPNAPVIFVSTKNPTWLPRLSQFIGILSRQNETFIIIDDEADQASLDTNINNNLPPSTVNREITILRTSLISSAFLQTTATPQSLLLQDEQDPFKPNFVVVTEPGGAYVGGNHFFPNDNFSNLPHLRLVDLIDLATLNNNQLPTSIVNSLFVFLTGAAVLRLEGYLENYTYLLHTSFRQADHGQAARLVREFVTLLMTELMPGGQLSNTTINGLVNAYQDLQATFASLPALQTIINEIRNSIASTVVSEVNSSTNQGVDPNSSRRHTIYVGGAEIGRGVTIKRLLVTYYGRDAESPQMDTVLQHARMYGYRQNELPTIRIYLPTHLAQRFYDIHASVNAVRTILLE